MTSDDQKYRKKIIVKLETQRFLHSSVFFNLCNLKKDRTRQNMYELKIQVLGLEMKTQSTFNLALKTIENL